MKRLLVLLLALLLPGCAAAETYGVSMSIDLDEAVFAAYAKRALQLDPQYAAYDLDALAGAVAKSLNGFGAAVAIQEDAATLKVNLAKGELLNLAVHTTKDAMYLTSPMLSGHAMWTARGSDDEAVELLNKTDWTSVSNGMGSAAERWLSDRQPVVTSGVFDGDAYSGGTRCITWSLTDMDIAALVSGLMTDELRAALLPLLEYMGMTAEALDDFDALNAQVANADTYLYTLQVVTNDADEFVGASLNIAEADAQIATLSFGMEGNAVKLVIGLGLNKMNYWWDFSGRQNRQENISYLSGTSREWVADKSASYSDVSAAYAPLATYLLRCSLTRSGERLLWDASISQGSGAVSEPLCSSSGSYVPETGMLEYSVRFGGGNNAPLRLNIRCGPVEAIPPMDSSLKLCSMTSVADAALYDELTNKFAASLIARMIKLLPMDLIMTINEFTLHE